MASRSRSSKYAHSRTRTAGAKRAAVESASDRFARLASFPFIRSQLSDEANRILAEELIFQRAVQLYLWALPSLNVYAMKEASERQFGKGYNVLPIFKDRLDAKAMLMTPNSDVIYAFGFLDLKEDGPLVVDTPPKLQGLIDDYRQRPLESVGEIGDRRWAGDIGFAGPDKGKGGKYLLLPPDFAGEIPEGYLPFRSSTYGVLLVWRAFFDDPAHLDAPVHLMEETRIYPITETHDTAKQMAFPNASGIALDMIYPHDYTAFEMLDRFIQHEYVDERDFELRGIAASLGIVKGKPFAPDARMRELLDAAAKTAWRMGHVLNMNAPRYYPDRSYVQLVPPTRADFGYDSYIDQDRRAAFFTLACSTSPAMFLNTHDVGSKYPTAFVDADGDPFDGDRSYLLHLPPDIPAKVFWSVTLYDPELGVGLDNGQAFPAINQMDQPQMNDDGSIDLYFAPTKPGRDKNWIATVPGKGFFVIIRLYGPKDAFYEQTWKPDDVVKL